MWGQQSQAQLNTQRQNNGQHTYNRAPHLPPDRVGDTLLHKHGLLGDVPAEGHSPFLAARHPGAGQNPFVALFALIGFITTIPVVLATAYRTGLFFHAQYGWPDLQAMIVMVAAAVVWPWLCRWVHFSGVNLQLRGILWFIPFRLVAFGAAFGLTTYFVTTWSWAGIDLLERWVYCNKGIWRDIRSVLISGVHCCPSADAQLPRNS